MSIARLARKLRRNIDDYGRWTAARKSLAYLASPVYQRTTYRIYMIELDSVSPPRAETNGLDYRVVDETFRGVIDQIERGNEWLRGLLNARLAAGALCLVALDGDTLAGFNLVAFDEVTIPLVRLRRTFRPGTAWSEHIAVSKDFRGRGIATELRLRVFEALRKRGVKKLYGGTLPSNTASLALARKLGFRELADVTYTKVLGWKTWKYRRRACRRVQPPGGVAVISPEPCCR